MAAYATRASASGTERRRAGGCGRGVRRVHAPGAVRRRKRGGFQDQASKENQEGKMLRNKLKTIVPAVLVVGATGIGLWLYVPGLLAARECFALYQDIVAEGAQIARFGSAGGEVRRKHLAQQM